jgi:hypothetical protein
MVKSITLKRWREVLAITLVIKLIIFFITAIINKINPSELFTAWIRWDGPHYIDLAKNWYQASGEEALWIVFYPLYPLLIKITEFFTNDFYFSAILVSTLFSFTASILLYELALLDFDKKVALRAVWFLNIFPTAFFLQASYTESLFLTFSLLSIYLYRRGSTFAGISGLFASFTRINGLTLIPYFFAESLSEKINIKVLVSLSLISILTTVGFSLYLIINQTIFGDFFYFKKPLAENWYKSFQLPWVSIKGAVSFAQNQTGDYFFLFWGELVAIIFALIFTVYTFIKIRFSYGVYMLTNLILFTSTSFIMSTPRYILILFPIYFALAKIRNKYITIMISLIFLSLLIKLSSFYTQGKWAY